MKTRYTWLLSVVHLVILRLVFIVSHANRVRGMGDARCGRLVVPASCSWGRDMTGDNKRVELWCRRCRLTVIIHTVDTPCDAVCSREGTEGVMGAAPSGRAGRGSVGNGSGSGPVGSASLACGEWLRCSLWRGQRDLARHSASLVNTPQISRENNLDDLLADYKESPSRNFLVCIGRGLQRSTDLF